MLTFTVPWQYLITQLLLPAGILLRYWESWSQGRRLLLPSALLGAVTGYTISMTLEMNWLDRVFSSMTGAFAGSVVAVILACVFARPKWDIYSPQFWVKPKSWNSPD